MSLVNYSDSEASDAASEDIPNPTKPPPSPSRKRKRDFETPTTLPPLPSSFHDLYASTVRTSNQDDPSLHGGRRRQTPHVEGHWPTHVYIEWHPSEAESSRIRRILDRVDDAWASTGSRVHSLLRNDLGTELPLHISLSRSLSLLADQRQPFVDTLKRNTHGSGVRLFKITVKGLRWVANYEGNRWFLVMQLEEPAENGLNRLLRASNMAAQAFGQPWLYSEAKGAGMETNLTNLTKRPKQQGNRDVPREQEIAATERDGAERSDVSSSFHISIGWSLHKPAESMDEKLDEITDDELSGLSLEVNSIKAKIGNVITVISLISEVAYSNRIIQT